MNLLEKLLEIQQSVDSLVKDGQNLSDKYNYVSSDLVLNTIRPKMNELKLLLFMNVINAKLSEGVTKSGTTRYMTEMTFNCEWIDVETGEKLGIPFYSQGVDLAGEKGVGKCITYCEKYFLLKQFHIGTSKDDPDNDGRTKTGEKAQTGTQAQKETQELHKKSITQMLNQIYANDAEKIKEALIAITKNDARQYAGVDSIDKISVTALPVIYANIKKAYLKRMGKEFEFVEEVNDAN